MHYKILAGQNLGGCAGIRLGNAPDVAHAIRRDKCHIFMAYLQCVLGPNDCGLLLAHAILLMTLPTVAIFFIVKNSPTKQVPNSCTIFIFLKHINQSKVVCVQFDS